MSGGQKYKAGDIVHANGRTWEVLAYLPPDMYRLKSHALEGTIRTVHIRPAGARAEEQYKREEEKRLARRY